MGIGHSGLSGVKAATFDLSAIGNNISNAGTVGFKKSTVEFADVMSGTVGGGVEVSDLRQSFDQGSIQGTGNTWDLAISGRGFFKVSEGSDDPNVAVKDNYYTRNGSFGVDADGYVVNSRGMRLHMFEAKNTGTTVEFPVSTNTTEIQIEQTDAVAKATEELTGVFNVDARVAARGRAVEPSTADLESSDDGTVPLTMPTASDTNRLTVGSSFILNGITVEASGSAQLNGGPANSTFPANSEFKMRDLDGNVVTISIGTGTKLDDFKTAINAKTDDTGVVAEYLSSGQLKLTSTEGDIVIWDSGADTIIEDLGFTVPTPGTAVAQNEVIEPGVSLDSLANDINASGTGVTAAIIQHKGADVIQMSASVNIEIAAGTGVTRGADTTGDLLDFAGLAPGPTNVSYDGVVDPTNDLTYDHSVTSILYDTLGSKQTVNTFFQKITDGHWEVFAQRVDSLGNTYPADKAETLKVATLMFDNTGGLTQVYSGENSGDAEITANPSYDTTAAVPVTANGAKITIPTGSAAVGKDEFLTMDIAGTNQFAGKFRIIDLSQDGYSSGALTGVDVDEDGVIRASYTNGNTEELGKVALFEFNNPHGLRQEGGVLWAETNDSGDARPGEPGESIFGRIKSQSLESSAVDVTSELVNLITAQRNFQANSKMISASKEMNQVVLNI